MISTANDQHLHYLDMVDKIAAKSKDRSTGIGAVLVPILQNANSFDVYACNKLPDGVDDTDARSERPAKYLYWEHAERNVIYWAAKHGIRTEHATLYTTGIPCADCARAVIQAGIGIVVVWKQGSGLEATNRWQDSINAGREMLLEAGVTIREIDRG